MIIWLESFQDLKVYQNFRYIGERLESVDSDTRFIGNNAHCSTAFDCSVFCRFVPCYRLHLNDNSQYHQSQGFAGVSSGICLDK